LLVLHITPSERAALECLSNGAAIADIARRLAINEPQVDAFLKALFARMGVTSRTEAVAAAVRRGLLAA